MDALIRGIGRVPHQRTTEYGTASQERLVASYDAPELAPVVQNRPRRRAAVE
jgi:hypothetical protein